MDTKHSHGILHAPSIWVGMVEGKMEYSKKWWTNRMTSRQRISGQREIKMERTRDSGESPSIVGDFGMRLSPHGVYQKVISCV